MDESARASPSPLALSLPSYVVRRQQACIGDEARSGIGTFFANRREGGWRAAGFGEFYLFMFANDEHSKQQGVAAASRNFSAVTFFTLVWWLA